MMRIIEVLLESLYQAMTVKYRYTLYIMIAYFLLV